MKLHLSSLSVIWLCLFGDKQLCPWERNLADLYLSLPLFVHACVCLCGRFRKLITRRAFHRLVLSPLFVHVEKGLSIICRHITSVDVIVNSDKLAFFFKCMEVKEKKKRLRHSKWAEKFCHLICFSPESVEMSGKGIESSVCET